MRCSDPGGTLPSASSMNAVGVLITRAVIPVDSIEATSAPGRMHIALVVNVSLAGRQVVSAAFHDFAGPSICGLFEKFPVGHFGDAGHLTVNRPARTVIVRRAVLRPLVDVGKNAKVQVWI